MAKTELGEQIIAAANVEDFRRKVFSIGPFGIRVGFTFQQERALNLVNALIEDDRIGVNDRILIVGGGLAGITAKVALHAMGRGNVLLIEKLDSILMMQDAASHRALHPCYNSWPIAERFSPTSNLPFLNWYSENAQRVVRFIRGRWKQLYSKALSTIRYEHSLKALELLFDEKGHPKHVKAEMVCHSDDSTKVELFDLVILATGFGHEQDLEKSASTGYWDPDKIKQLRDKAKTGHVLVSGIGDGGLMDFARLAFDHADLEDSDLAVETISRLRHSRYKHPRRAHDDDNHLRSPIENKIASVERQALNLLPQVSPEPSDFGTEIENEIAAFLAQGYSEAIDMLPDSAVSFLQTRIHPVFSNDRLVLVGRLTAPFTCATAPINKLLVAYLLSRRSSFYQQGFIDLSKKTLVTKANERALASDTLIIRHGGQPPAFTVNASFARQIKRLNRAMANLVDIPRPDVTRYTDLTDFVSAPPFSPAMVEYVTTLAEAFASSNAINLSLTHSLDPTRTSLWFEFKAEEAEARREAIVGRLGGFPHEIFGRRLVAKESEPASNGLGSK